QNRLADCIIEQSDFFREPDTEHHRKHKTQRCKTCEVLEHRRDDELQPLTGEKIPDRQLLPCARVADRCIKQTEYVGHENHQHSQSNEKRKWIREFITHPLDDIQDPLEYGSFLRHDTPHFPLAKNRMARL